MRVVPSIFYFSLFCFATIANAQELETETVEPARAPPVECADIDDDQARLSCYDGRERSDEDEVLIVPVPAADTVLAERQQEELELFESSWGILPYNRSYVLPFTYVKDINEEPYEDLIAEDPDEELKPYEIKFQYSFKVPIGRRFVFGHDQLYFGYTQVSLWQAYNPGLSSPIRESNYQPELLWSIPIGRPLLGGRLSHVVLGLNHQSNGRSDALSRSWNRITFDAIWADDEWAVSTRLWYRIPEDSEDDDNPDIEDYLGYGNIRVGYSWDEYRFTGIFTNNLQRHDNRTSVDLSISKPISRKLRGFVQFYNGYGETLIDYNYRTKRIGFGVVLSDWF